VDQNEENTIVLNRKVEMETSLGDLLHVVPFGSGMEGTEAHEPATDLLKLSFGI